METKTARWTLGDLAKMLNGDLTGPADMPIDRPVAADTNDPRGIAFAESDKYLDRAEGSEVGAVLLNREIRETTKPAIRVDDPRTAFFMLLKMSERPLPFTPGIHPSAVIAPGTVVDSSASIGAFVVIESGVEIGANVQVFPFSYIGENCKIGAKTIIYPRVTLYRDVVVGEEVILHSGVVVGADGFGFVWDGQRRLKVPQVGTVVMGDNVEIGANTTIDRATVGETSIGKGTKIDNLVQVAHNDVIGEHVVIAGCTAVAGSVRIGDRCVIGGMVGFRDHVELEDDVFVAGMSGIEKNLAGPGQYFGVPALPALEAMRIFKATQRTPELLSRIRDLEKKVGE